MEEIIVRFGLLAVYLGASIEGDVILILSGVVAHLGFMNLPTVVGIGAGGCFTGDLIWYSLGRFRSDAIRNSKTYRLVGPTVERIARRIGPWQIATSRLLYGTRMATMLYWGVQRLSFLRFSLIDLLSCVVWASLLGTLGYAASRGAMTLIGEVKQIELWLLGAVAFSIIVFLAIRIVLARTRITTGGKQ